MEEIFVRFPQLGKQILEQLDNKALIKTRVSNNNNLKYSYGRKWNGMSWQIADGEAYDSKIYGAISNMTTKLGILSMFSLQSTQIL